MVGETFDIITLKGPMKFSITNRSLYEYEQLQGHQPLQTLFSGDYGPKAVSHLMYAGLKSHKPDITLDEAIDLVDYKNIDQTIPVFIKAIKSAYDIGEDPEDETAPDEDDVKKKETSG